jgi:catechol 2,3-dioxygenase-like lactoylglutathione lyase family enzyme
MITSIHAMIYSDDAPATRAFLRNVLGWPFVAMPDHESGDDAGWQIFKAGPSEIGVHPTSGIWEGKPYSHPKTHSISLMCDDIHATVAELKAKGAEFEGDVQDHGYGLFIDLLVPGAGTIGLYEPRHPTAYSL